MYVILQFFTHWVIYDQQQNKVRHIDLGSIESLRTLFEKITATTGLTTIQIQTISPSKWQRLPQTGYVLIRSGDAWTCYQGSTYTTYKPDDPHITRLKDLVPSILDKQTLVGVTIDRINPKKFSPLDIEHTTDGKTPIPSAAATPAK